MQKKRILIFIDWFTPGYKAGGPISSNENLIDHLKDEIDFYVITRNTDYCESKPYDQVISDAWNTLPNGSHVYYLSKKNLSFSSLIKISKSISFDSVFINGIYSLYFSLFPLIWFKYFVRNRIVVSARGMLSDHTFSSKRLKKKLYYFIARFLNIYKGVIIHATNDNEQIQIRKNLGFKGEIRIAPNLPPRREVQFIPIQKTSGELRLLSIARISPEKNTLFALNVLKDLARNISTAGTINHIIFDLYGTIYDEEYWDQCRIVINNLPAFIEVQYRGSLAKEKVHETIQNYHFLFMPSQGENYGHSIIESFMASRPVIISNRTPWKNLNCVLANHNSEITIHESQIESISSPVGWDLPLEEPQKFVDALTTATFMNQNDYNIMSNSSFEFSRSIVNNRSVVEANVKLFI
jgi:glycosyltransferase involved in cell wall biosynthesis